MGEGGASMGTGLWEAPVSVLARMKAASWVVTGAWHAPSTSQASQTTEKLILSLVIVHISAKTFSL